RDSRTECACETLEVIQHFVQVDFLWCQHLTLAKGAELVGKRRGRDSAGRDCTQRFSVVIWPPPLLSHQFSLAHDDGQRIVHDRRKPGSQPAEDGGALVAKNLSLVLPAKSVGGVSLDDR